MSQGTDDVDFDDCPDHHLGPGIVKQFVSMPS